MEYEENDLKTPIKDISEIDENVHRIWLLPITKCDVNLNLSADSSAK